MAKITLGDQDYNLKPARTSARLKKILDTQPKFAELRSQVVYFWDCATQTGLPQRRAKNVNAAPAGSFWVFNRITGRRKQADSRQNLRFHAGKINRTGPELTADLRKAFPVLSAGIPYATHVDPFKKNYRLMLVAHTHFMTLTAQRTNAALGEKFFWITVPTKFTFTTTLLNRCDDTPVVAPEGWNPSIEIPVELNEMTKGLKELHDAAVAPPPNEH